MERCKGRKILGVILFCFVFCAVYGLPASAIRNNLFILLPISSATRFPEIPANSIDNHFFGKLPNSTGSPNLLTAETSIAFNNESSYSDIISDPNKITESYTVNCPTDAGNITGAKNICAQDGKTTLVSDVPGGTWSSSDNTIAVILDPTMGLVTAMSSGGGKKVIITYTIPATGECPELKSTFEVTIDDLPTIDAISKPEDICQGGTTKVLDGIGKIHGGATGGRWSTPAGGTFNPNETTLNATWTPPSNFTGEAVLTLTTTGGTCAAVSVNTKVNVNAVPTVTATPLTQTICSGTNISKIVLSGAVAGTTYNWVRDNGSNVTGIANSGSGDIIGSLTNTTAVQQTVKFTITPTVNGCQGSAVEATVIVYPKLSSVISVNGNSSICSGKTAEVWISFTGSGPFKYTLNNGAEVTATGNPEKLTVSPSVNTTYTVTSLKDNNCVAQASNMTGSAAITVLSLPQLTSALSTSVCSGTPFSYTPGVSIAGTTYKWVRASVAGISNASSEGTGPINEILTNTTTSPVNVVYTFELTSPDAQACSKTQNVTVTVSPVPVFTVSANYLRACVGTPIIISANPGSVSGYTYSLTYIPDGSGIYPVTPTFSNNTSGSFTVYPIVGKHTYRLTATNAQGCSLAKDIQVKVFDIPTISITPSCSEQSVTMTGTMIGTSSNPSNFTDSDLGFIQYSYDNGATWRTTTYWGPNLPLGVFGVLARNSAAIDIACNTSISANITLTSVLTQNVNVCQGLPAPSFSAVALCSGWSSSSQMNNMNPSNSNTYLVSNSANAPYTQGPLVAFLATEIFTVNKNNPQITFDDCSNNQGSDFSYSIYEYPFNANNPSHGFVTMVRACPKVTIPLDPNKYYQIVVNDYNPNSNNSASIKFNGNDRSQVLNNTTEVVSWYKADGTFIVSNNSFNPVTSGIIPNTNTPGSWKFYAACGNSGCRQEVNFTIDPIPTGSSVGSNQIVTCSSQETNIQLQSVDKYGNPVPSGSVSYTWKTDIVAQDLSKITITHNTCTSGCGNIIRETVTNSGTTTAIVDFTITPKGGDCVGQDFHVYVRVEPMPDFSITNTNTIICPSANPQIVPIQVVSLNSNLITGLSYQWSRTNTANLPASPVGSVPASGIEANPDGFTISGTLAGLFPKSLQTTVFTVEAQVNAHTCVTKTTAVTVGDETAPVITCPVTAMTYDCITKIPAAATDYNSFVALGGTATDNCTVQPIVTHVGDVLISGNNCNGKIRRTYRARDYAGNTSECYMDITIVNNSLAAFTTTPPATFDRCVYDISSAIFDPLTVDILPSRPDFYRLNDADKAILSNITYNGNCNITLHWKILDSNNNPIRDENSDLLQDKTDAFSSHPIKLNGAVGNEATYRLIYWLQDGCGSKSADYTVIITIKPRPIINKVPN